MHTPTEPPTTRPSPRVAGWIIALPCALALGLLYLTWAPPEPAAPSAAAVAPSPAPTLPVAGPAPVPAPAPCSASAAPGNGATTIVAPAVMRRSDVNFSTIEIVNDSGDAVLARLLSVTDDAPLATLYVGAGQRAQLSAPSGEYGLELLRGMRWCAGLADLAGASRLRSSEALRTVDGQSGELTISPAPQRTGGIALSWRLSPPLRIAATPPVPAAPVAAPTRRGTLELRADANGHHTVAGSLNQHPLRFIVDTGASMVSVSRTVANAAGLYRCDARAMMATANGSVEACIVRDVALTVGEFALAGIDVAVLPTLEAEALLGMNALRAFRIEWAHDVMSLAPR